MGPAPATRLIVRIEFILSDEAKARGIAEDVAKSFFDQYAGVVYVYPVEIIRAERF